MIALTQPIETSDLDCMNQTERTPENEAFSICLLGTRIWILSTFGVIIDFASKCIIIKHSKVPIRTDLPPNPVIVRVKETCFGIISGRSEIFCC